MLLTRGTRRWTFPTALLFYALLTAAAVFVHTFWRDETQAWLLARDSSSPLALLANMRYEGHPPLWHLLLYPFAHLSGNPQWMKLLNWLFSCFAAALILRETRLRLATRLGFAFSYFLLFEYAVLSRNYMLGIVLLLAAATLLLRESSSGSPAIPVLLSLAAFSSLPALILALCLFGVYATQSAFGPLAWHPAALRAFFASPARLGAGLFFLLSTFASILLIRPPYDTGVFLANPHLPGGIPGKLMRLGKYVGEAYLPLPRPSRHFWNSTLIDSFPFHLGTALGWALLVALVLFFRRPAARLFFSASTLLLLAQVTASGRPFLRHLGWLFVAFLLALLLEHAPRTAPGSVPRLHAALPWRAALLAVLLVAQVATALFAIGAGFLYPFSPSLQAAQFLRQHHLAEAPLLFEPDYEGASILAYLQRRDAWNIEQHRLASFVLWDRQEYLGRHTPTLADLHAASGASASAAPVLITEDPLTPQQQIALHLQLLAAFPDDICDMESYYIYR